ncbi:amidohydrolase family protein [Amycolatopsis sp. GM8]|uniref:amidohydrolase family protein n=1 Tax=Amycolatopsis sp. GM8 TaxID=2896530 RepID=UPI001F4454FC|nr:amidohydrolase family protein [Amycolatopsis sp. GM8]
MDLDDIIAIDVHTHVWASVGTPSGPTSETSAMARYFGTDARPATVPEMARYYRERRIACVAFTVDARTETGRLPAVTNDEIAEQAGENSDIVIPFASVDPRAGRVAVTEARRLVEHYHVKGFKFHPNSQAFYPNDRAYYPLYEVLEQAGVPALFHSGQTGVGAGVPGGGGVRLKYSNPMFLDDVAVDFPDLPIVLAHPSFPWQDEALSVAVHKPNVYIDLSGWSPKYFPANLIHYANTLIKDKVLFGSDFPVITPDRWLADFEKIDIKPEVRPLILKDNAARLLGLSEK